MIANDLLVIFIGKNPHKNHIMPRLVEDDAIKG